MNEEYGVINEVGDLGLGFTKLSNDDLEALKEATKEDGEKNKGVDDKK